MNPKEIINSELICKLAKAAYHNDVVIYSLYDELLRRLSEADALRKENEDLRKDKERLDFLDDGNYGIDPRNIPGVQMNGRRFHCLAGRGDWNTLRGAIDAARLAKESEENE